MLSIDLGHIPVTPYSPPSIVHVIRMGFVEIVCQVTSVAPGKSGIPLVQPAHVAVTLRQEKLPTADAH
jgi:hypothetical protein